MKPNITVQALMDVTGKPQEVVEAFLQKKLDQAKADKKKLSKIVLYGIFKRPGSPTRAAMDWREAEKAAKKFPQKDPRQLEFKEILK